ncbi:MAG: flippase-like domain-containing protein [Bacteroidaceae bacterium]|nr:flippase-like domain-containing protein [Bacteroidaceae bacterium]
MKLTKKVLNNIFFLCGVAAVVVMMFTFDVSFTELWMHLCHAGYWLIPIIGVWCVIYGINAWSWMCIIKGNKAPDEHVSFWRIYKLTVTGYALNYATPVGGLGGEPYRIIELSRDISKQHATSSVILYAMMHMFAHCLFWFSSILLYLLLSFFGDVPMTPAIGITLGAFVVVCVVVGLFFAKGYRNGLVVRGLRWIGRIPGLRNWSQRFMTNHSESLHQIDAQIAALHQQDKRAFYCSLFLEYFSRVVQSLEVMFMLLLFNIDCGGGFTGYLLVFLHSVLILAFTTLFANLIGFLPMQLGVQEGGFVLSIAALGLSAALGIFVSIICRVREIIWILVGIILMKIHPAN